MGTKVMSPAAWSAEQFEDAQLNDARLTQRLVKVATALATHPTGVLPPGFGDWAALKAAYRLLNNDKTSYERIISPHWQRTRQTCEEPGEYLFVEDTTELDFTSHFMTEGLGEIGNGSGRGMFVHSTLALRIERWSPEPDVTVVGLIGQQIWAREEKTPDRLEEKRDRLKRERESQCWAATYDALGPRPAKVRWTHVGDRGSDIYEVFERCERNDLDYLVRASQPRALADDDRSLFDAVAESEPLGRFELPLRSRPGHKARTAVVEVRARRVTLRGPWRPDIRLANRETGIVEAKEIDAPEGVEPIHWRLLTSWEIDDFASCLRVVKAYAKRWLIEEYHKALKTGAGIEQSQLSTVCAIQTLLGILAVVAVRLLSMKLLATTRGEDEVDPAAAGEEVLKILEAKYGKPAEGWTHRTLLFCIARLGGFIGRKSDGNPGWKNIWRGWDRLMILVQGYNLARDACRCG